MKKIALIMSHPGHELRIFRFLEVYQPRVYVFTDGSGWTDHSRLPSTEKILDEVQCTRGSVFGRFTDREIYEWILQKNAEPFYLIIDEILADIKKHAIDTIVGDACEGFVSSHDLCRYMIDTMVAILQREESFSMGNYDFLLEGSPNTCPEELKQDALWIQLSTEDLRRKVAAAKGYKELQHEVEKTISMHGEKSFSVECLRPVRKLHKFQTWESVPGYEQQKEEKMKAGLFSELITFKDHLLPMGKLIADYAQRSLGATV